MLHERLQALMNQKKMTASAVSKLSGVPETTVRNIVTGKTPDPGLQNVVDIVKALGGSMDDIVGIERPPVTADQHLIALYERSAQTKDAWIKRLWVAFCTLVAAVIAIVFIDILNGGIGYIRY